MALSYLLRVVCLIALCVGLIQVIAEVLLWLAAPFIQLLANSLPLRARERTLYGVQLAPVLIALLLTASFFLPQYLSHETNLSAEHVSVLCVVMAASLYAWWGASLLRGARMALRTMLFSRACRGVSTQFTAKKKPLIAVSSATNRVALVGLIRPFIFISKSLLDVGGLDPTALQVVLDHERSHAAHRDNWKLLSLHCLPRLDLRLPSGRTWMQLWRTAAEWAADEDAVRGNRAHAIILAETLVTLARAPFTTKAESEDGAAITYLLWQDAELSRRVERLLDSSPERASNRVKKLSAMMVLAVSGVGILMALSATMRDLPERLLHIG